MNNDKITPFKSRSVKLHNKNTEFTLYYTKYIQKMLKTIPLSGQFSLKIKSHWITQVENHPHGISGIDPLTQDNNDTDNHSS